MGAVVGAVVGAAWLLQVDSASFRLHLKPHSPGPNSRSFAQAPKAISPAGHSPGLQVFPGSFPDEDCVSAERSSKVTKCQPARAWAVCVCVWKCAEEGHLMDTLAPQSPQVKVVQQLLTQPTYRVHSVEDAVKWTVRAHVSPPEHGRQRRKDCTHAARIMHTVRVLMAIAVSPAAVGAGIQCLP